jgi:hypothetical protein
VLHQ